MYRLTLVALILCAACEKKPAAPRGELVDEGTLVTTLDGKVTSRETFAIRKVDGHLVITANSSTVDGVPHANVQDGELETDLQYRPLKLSYHYKAGADSFRYVLGGTPLALDRIRDDGQNPQHVASHGPIDVFVEGPGLIGMTAVCRVAQPITLETLSDFESGYKGKVVVKTVAPAGKLVKRTIKFLDDFEVELYCEGEKLIASGLRGNKIWNVREGREADIAPFMTQE
ncbi:hypothetical protein BH11MYX3_BH11MYX3_39590 [soil metagenome]